jgi:hypothetical protein
MKMEAAKGRFPSAGAKFRGSMIFIGSRWLEGSKDSRFDGQGRYQPVDEDAFG